MKKPQINFRKIAKNIFNIDIPKTPQDAIMFGWEVGGWLYDLITPDLITDDEERRAIELYKKNNSIPVDILIKSPEKPFNQVKPVPKKIYDKPPVPPDYDIKLPEMPPRVLPPPVSVSTNTETEYTSDVHSNLTNRKFGCLFAKPFYRDGITWCQYDVPKNFWSDLFTTMQQDIEDYKEALKNKEGYPNSFMDAWISYPQSFSDKPFILRTTRAIDEIAYMYFARTRELDNYPLTGMLSVKGIEEKNCGQSVATQLDTQLFLEMPLLSSFPLTSFDDYEGLKYDQLHIIWKDTKGSRLERTTVIPLPKPDINTDLLKQTLPQNLDFGDTIYEMLWKLPESATAISNVEVQFKQKAITKIYGTGETDDEYKNFIEKNLKIWINALSKPELKLARWSTKKEADKEIYKSKFFPHRAILYGWETETDKKFTKWIVKGEWYIYETNPT